MTTPPTDFHRRLSDHGQDHVLTGWERLSADDRRTLTEQLSRIDFEHLDRLYAARDEPPDLPPAEALQPATLLTPEPSDRAAGEAALGRGEVAVLLVAGGQGSRMGATQPKGMFPVGPVSDKTLYQIHAEKVLAVRRRYGRPVPLLVMTSPATDAETRAFFAEHRNFGLPEGEVRFFVQGTMPALDLATGRLLLEAPGRLFLSPDGHGGTLAALRSAGLLDELAGRGVKHLFYFQVDNPLVKVADPAFLGLHIRLRAEASSKAVPKRDALDRMGVFGTVGGRCRIIEYSDLPEALARATEPDGRLRFRAGSTAIHWFDLGFLTRTAADAQALPFHVARKKVPHWDPVTGQKVDPTEPNALKFERFIFDILPLASSAPVVETTREEEFAPLKNAEGDDSPETVRRAMIAHAAAWLEQAGATVRPDVAVEIDPLYALDAEQLAGRLDRGVVVHEPRHFTDRR